MHIRHAAISPICGLEKESLYPSLLTCDQAKLFCEVTRVSFELKISRLHLNTWIVDILDPCLVPKEEVAIMVTFMWAVCHLRNNCTHGESRYQPQHPMIIIYDIVRALEFPVLNKGSCTDDGYQMDYS